MSRLEIVQGGEGKQKELLEVVAKKMGKVPNMLGALAQSPAALEAYLNLSGALSHGVLDAKTREQIALAVGEVNSCGYCLAAHSAIGKSVGLTDQEIAEGRKATSSDAKTAVILALSKQIVESQGNLSDSDVQKAKDAGVTQPEIAEIVANVGLNIFTNYFNHVADPEIDFPKAA